MVIKDKTNTSQKRYHKNGRPLIKFVVPDFVPDRHEQDNNDAEKKRLDDFKKNEKAHKKLKRYLLELLLLLLLLILLGLLVHNKKAMAVVPAPLKKQIFIKKLPELSPHVKKQIVLINFKKNFLQLVGNLDKPQNKYLSKHQVPFHSAENFIVEAVDYGKISTSEAVSVKLWLSVIKAAVTKNWAPFYKDWSNIDKYYIPRPKEQPNAKSYTPYMPANYVAMHNNMTKYPSRIEFEAAVGQDPIGDELDAKYGPYPYLLHWYIDVDNWYGFEKNKTYVKVDLFARGPHESTFKTIPHPSFDKNGGTKKGFVNLFVGSKDPQWRYSSAPDAELRIGQAMYWAELIAREQKVNIKTYVKKATRLGEYSRYALFDKYFRKIGAGGIPGNAFESCHYLVSWCVAWGGGIKKEWAWRIGESQIHAGYQNPLGALYFSQKNISLWKKSIDRQLELVSWLQSKEGPIGGGVKNDYNKPGGPFHGMNYVEHPVFLDPQSNIWAGWQYFLIDRIAEYYFFTGDTRAEKILTKWVAWIIPNIAINNEDVKIPTDLAWSGSPEKHTLSGRITGRGHDVGGQSLIAMTLLFWDKGSQKWHGKSTGTGLLAKKILSVMWNKYYDGKGIAIRETRQDYSKCFTAELVIPSGVKKEMPWGKVIKKGSKFIDARPSYHAPAPRPGPYTAKNPAPSYRYHRSWAQFQYAIALGYVYLFEHDQLLAGKTP